MKRAISLATRAPNSNRKVVELPEFCGIKLLAKAAKSAPESVLKALGYRRDKKLHFDFMNQHFTFKSMNSIVIPFPIAARFLLSRGIEVRFREISMTEEEHKELSENLPAKRRGAVAAMLGHFSHGKTSLLDALAGTDVAGKGITQQIRSVRIEGKAGKFGANLEGGITFIDTPGQDIFHRMRSQSSRVADVGVLVVSAVEGLCPQTKESIGCAEESGMPLVAAINKMDLLMPSTKQARVDELIQEIREYTVLETSPIVLTSATTGEGLPQMISTVNDTASLLSSKSGLQFHPSAPARGVVMNLIKVKGQGYMLTTLVEDGTLSVGDMFVAGEWSGKVRALLDENRQSVKKISAGRVVDVVFSVQSSTESSPVTESFYVVSKDRMQAIIEQRMMAKNLQLHAVEAPPTTVVIDDEDQGSVQINRRRKIVESNVFLKSLDDKQQVDERSKVVSSDEGFQEESEEKEDDDDDEEEEDTRPLLVVKADSAVTLGVVVDALAVDDVEEADELSPNLQARMVHGGVGEVIPRDIMMASALDQEVLCFNVAVSNEAKRKAKESNVSIIQFSVLQELLDHIASKVEARKA